MINIEEYDKEYFVRVAGCSLENFYSRYSQVPYQWELGVTEATLTIRQLINDNTVVMMITDASYLAKTEGGLACFLRDNESRLVSPEGVVIYARVLPLTEKTAKSLVTHIVFARGYKIIKAAEMLKNLGTK